MDSKTWGEHKARAGYNSLPEPLINKDDSKNKIEASGRNQKNIHPSEIH